MGIVNSVAGEVTKFEAKIPGMTVEAPEPYEHGQILKLQVEVRVCGLEFVENKEGFLTRRHKLSIEDIEVVDHVDPSSVHDGVEGGLAGQHDDEDDGGSDFEPATVPSDEDPLPVEFGRVSELAEATVVPGWPQ